MHPNNNISRNHRPNRWARLKKQFTLRRAVAELTAELSKTRQERAAAIAFIRTIRRWPEFEQFINLTCCHNYERLERRIMEQARAAYGRQQKIYAETGKSY